MYEIYNDDCRERLDQLGENSIDCIVTDPPYELGFMGKSWDKAGVSFDKDTWAKCLRVLKPGGYLLAFGGTRTYHRIAYAIEEAGFEIKDMINWVYGSGMPKGLNIGIAIDKRMGVESKVVGIGKSGAASTHTRTMHSQTKDGKDVFGGKFEVKEAQNEWKGWNTAIKPSHEPIVVAQKPFKGTFVDNILNWKVGAFNIDKCRIEHNEPTKTTNRQARSDREIFNTKTSGFDSTKNTTASAAPEGRYPANTILTYDENDKDEVCGGFPNTKGGSKVKEKGDYGYCFGEKRDNKPMADGYDDNGSAARYFKNCPFEKEDFRSYFYSAKASKKDRDEGLDNFEAKAGHTKGNGLDRICEFCGVSQLTPELCHCEKKSWVAKPKRNTHATVKPTELMRYLIRLVSPKGATILDPFMGSGSTGKAAMLENAERNANYKFVGIEKETEYFDIAKARISYVIEKYNLKENE